MARCGRARISSPLCLLCLGLALGLASSVRADGEKARQPGLLGEIRRALSPPDASRIWSEASRDPSAERAFARMEDLAGRSGGPESVAASLWLGHFEYGAGQIPEALRYFEQALHREPSEADRSEALFWRAQCRTLLGPGEAEEGAGEAGALSPGTGVHSALAALVRLDAQLRVGHVSEALRGYLALEGDARRAGCLGPLLYRIGLAVATAGVRTERPAIGWDLVEHWESFVPASPERALVAAMIPAPPAEASAESLATPGSSPAAPRFPESVPEAAPSESEEAVPSRGAAPTPAGGSSAPRERSPLEQVRDRSQGAGGQESEALSGDESYYVIQLGAFIDAERARREFYRLREIGLPVHMEQEDIRGVTYYRIRMGRANTRSEAEAQAERSCAGLDWQVVRIVP